MIPTDVAFCILFLAISHGDEWPKWLFSRAVRGSILPGSEHLGVRGYVFLSITTFPASDRVPGIENVLKTSNRMEH